MTSDFGCCQRAAMPHIKPPQSSVNESLQGQAYSMWIIFKGWGFGMAGSDEPTQQNS